MFGEYGDYFFDNGMVVGLYDSELSQTIQAIDDVLKVLVEVEQTAYIDALRSVLWSNRSLLERALSDAKGEEND